MMHHRLRLYGPPLALVVVIFIIVRGILGFNGLYGQDAFEYLRYSRALRLWLLTGADPGDYFWPVGYPLAGALISAITGHTGLVLQLISLFSFIGLIVYMARMVKLLHGEASPALPAFLLVLLAASPFLLRASLLCMSDMGAAFLLLAACYHFLKSTHEKSFLHFVVACAAAAAAVMFRYVSVILWLPAAAYAGISLLRQRQWLAIPAGMLAAGVMLLPHYLLRREASGEFLGHVWLTHWSPANYWKQSFNTPDGLLTYPLPNLLNTIKGLIHPGYALLVLVILPFWRPKDWSGNSKFIAAGFVLNILFITGMPVQGHRYLLPSTALWLLLLYPAFSRLYGRLHGAWKPVVFTVAWLIQIGLTAFAMHQVYQRYRLEYSIRQYLSTYHRGKEIYTMDMDVSLKGYETPLIYYNLWEKRYTDFHPGALVLLQEQRWAKQWKGRNPMLNWEAIQQEHEVAELQKFGDDWTLYEIR